MMQKKTQGGITLLELMLVLAIAATIAVVAFRQIESYQEYGQTQQVMTNAERLFGAAKNYYFANCRGRFNPNATSSSSAAYSGTLNPANTTLANKALNIQDDLITPGFLDNPLKGSPLIDGSSANAYIVQFNINPANSGKTVYACWNFTGTPECSTAPQNTLATPIISWNIQVAIKLPANKEENAEKYRVMTNANCLSSSSGDIVTPCSASSTGSTGNTYLVWQRQSSYATSQSESGLWVSAPVLKQFVSQYTNDPNYEMNNPGYATTTGINYLCGG